MMHAMRDSLQGVAEPHDPLAVLAARCHETMRTDACVIRRLEGDRLVLVACVGVDGSTLPAEITPNVGAAHRLLHERTSLAIENTFADKTTLRLAYQATRQPGKFQFLSFAGARIATDPDGEPLGVLGVYHCKILRYFTAKDLEILEEYGLQAAAFL